jgi:hypothetical protein
VAAWRSRARQRAIAELDPGSTSKTGPVG